MRLTLRAITAAALITASFVASSAVPASAVPTWAPAATAAVHPGVQTFTQGAQCAANFIFYNATHVYIGQAAHCSGTGAATETNGCVAHSLPLGTKVDVTGASQQGTMVYNSWIAMQLLGETNADTCAFNDLALVELSAADAAKVNPSIPFWGGPTGVSGAGTAVGSSVYSYGNSELRLGLAPLSPKRGISLGDAGSGWSHTVYTLTPGIPGDSGSAFLDGSGHAIGVLSTVAIAPLAGSNGVGDVSRELSYLNGHTAFAVTLATGTEPFDPDRLI